MEKGYYEVILNSSQSDTVDSIFKEYREKYNLLDDSTWYIELGRLFELSKTTNIAEVANKVKELYL